jgi:hypothetical protein
MPNTTTINISKQTLAELEDIVPHREHDSWTTIIDRAIDLLKGVK